MPSKPEEPSVGTRLTETARHPDTTTARALGTCDTQGRIAADAVIGAFVHVPADVIIGSAAVIGDGTSFAAPDGQMITVGAQVRIGAGATLCRGIAIGEGAVVLPGAVVTRSVPANAIVQGNPATIVNYVAAGVMAASAPISSQARLEPVGVGGVTVHHFPVINDIRGSLTVGEFDREIPFVPLRYFMVFDVPSRETRGEHAHRECHQFLICVRGSCAVLVDNGSQRAEIRLDSPTIGIPLPPMTWGVQYKYSADALLLVFASHHYDSADYIRDYAEFIAEQAAK